MPTPADKLPASDNFAVHLDAASSQPVFEQIVTRIRDAAVTGELPVGTKLATVRALATELGVATNTVAKAYRTLAAEGTVTTGGREGTVIARHDAQPAGALNAALGALLAEAKNNGLDREQLLGLVARSW